MQNDLPYDDVNKKSMANEMEGIFVIPEAEELTNACIRKLMSTPALAEFHMGGADGHQPHPDGSPQLVHNPHGDGGINDVTDKYQKQKAHIIENFFNSKELAWYTGQIFGNSDPDILESHPETEDVLKTMQAEGLIIGTPNAEGKTVWKPYSAFVDEDKKAEYDAKIQRALDNVVDIKVTSPEEITVTPKSATGLDYEADKNFIMENYFKNAKSSHGVGEIFMNDNVTMGVGALNETLTTMESQGLITSFEDEGVKYWMKNSVKKLAPNEIMILDNVDLYENKSLSTSDVYNSLKSKDLKFSKKNIEATLDEMVKKGLVYKKTYEGKSYWRKDLKFAENVAVFDNAPADGSFELVKANYPQSGATANILPKEKKIVMPLGDNRLYAVDESVMAGRRKTNVLYRDDATVIGKLNEKQLMDDDKYKKWGDLWRNDIAKLDKDNGTANTENSVALLLKRYQDGCYSKVNEYLRGTIPLSSEISVDAINNAEDAIRYTTRPAPEDMIVFRGTKVEDMPKIYEEFRDGKNKRYSDRGFMSTTIAPGKSESWAGGSNNGVVFEMHIPKGMPVAPIQFGEHDTEREILIRPSQDWKIVGMHSDSHDGQDNISGKYYVILEPINL